MSLLRSVAFSLLAAPVAGRLAEPTTPLCADSVVAETCALIDASRGETATPAAVQEILASTAASAEAFWRSAGLSDGGAPCAELCSSTTALLKTLGRRLPRASDTGCYLDEVGDTICDLDLAPATMQQMAEAMPDVPFSEGKSHQHNNEGIDRDAEVAAFGYSVEEVAMRVAQLFRIYPAQDFDIQLAPSQGPTIESTPTQKALLTRRLRQAQAYVNIALRTFPANRTREEATMYFGRPALVSMEPRRRIQMVLNSVNNVLSNATFIYPGPSCTSNVFAYVYPCTGGGDREKDPRDRFYVHLCDLFFTVRDEQICTLVHEASHHSAACTDDVQYGPERCQELARKEPRDALRNADNYGYYIRQVARTFGTF